MSNIFKAQNMKELKHFRMKCWESPREGIWNKMQFTPVWNTDNLPNITTTTGIYLFKVNNGHTRTMCQICSELTIKKRERRQWRRSGVFNVNYEQISQIVLVFPLLTLNKKTPAGTVLLLNHFSGCSFQITLKTLEIEGLKWPKNISW